MGYQTEIDKHVFTRNELEVKLLNNGLNILDIQKIKKSILESFSKFKILFISNNLILDKQAILNLSITKQNRKNKHEFQKLKTTKIKNINLELEKLKNLIFNTVIKKQE